MIDQTEEALKEVIAQTAKIINHVTQDEQIRESLNLALIAIAAGSFRMGLNRGYLKGRAEYE